MAEAADLWDEPPYLIEARAIVRDLVRVAAFEAGPHGLALRPAARGFSADDRLDGPIVNLSYWVFPAFARLAQAEPRAELAKFSQSGLSLVESAPFGAMGLPADWLSLRGGKVTPARGLSERLGYDAIRIPLYLFWAGALSEDLARPFAPVFAADSGGAAQHDFSGRSADASSPLSEPGYRAVAALIRCAAEKTPYPQAFYRFAERQNYYPATLHLLAVVAAAARGGPCLDREALRGIAAPGWRPRAGSLERLTAIAAKAEPEDALPPPPPRAALTRQIPPPLPAPVESFDSKFGDGPILYFRVAAIAFAAVALAFGLARRRRRGAGGARGAAGGILPASNVCEPNSQYGAAPVPVPRTLPLNPFTLSRDPTTLAREIENAAEACLPLSRTIGVVYFEVRAFGELQRELGAADADAAVTALATAMRSSLRATDHVAVLNRDQIVVCICLLANALDLESVANRLKRVAQGQGAAGAQIAAGPTGYAIYALNGYEGSELIEAARCDYRSQIAAPLIEAVPEPKNALLPAPPAQAPAPRRRKQPPNSLRKR